jgi:hypothetical protein
MRRGELLKGWQNFNQIKIAKATGIESPNPTGLNHPAQGCEARATLGNRPTNVPTLKGLNQ